MFSPTFSLIMASVWKRENSKYWYACFTAPNGRRLKKSTGLKDRRQALKIAEELEDAYRGKRAGKQLRKVFSEAHKDVTGKELPSTSLKDYTKTWISRKKGEIAESTLGAYKRSIASFLEWLGDRANDEIEDVDTQDLIRYRDHLVTKMKHAPRTVNQRIKGLRMMFEDARCDGWVTENPVSTVKPVKEPNSEPGKRPFTLDELKKALAAAEGDWRTMIYLGLYTGQRLGDLAAFRWSQVNFQSNEIAITTRKTGRRVLIPIAAPLREHLLSLPSSDSPDSPVVPNINVKFESANADNRTGRISREFTELLASAGLREKRDQKKKDEGRTKHGLSFHSLRYTAVSLMKNAGISAAIVQDLIGHESAEMSAHYTKIESAAKLIAVDSLPDLTEQNVSE